mgnify:CR=1 FL=1
MANELVTIGDALALAETRFVELGSKPELFLAEQGFAMQLLSSNTKLMSVARENPASLRDAIVSIASVGLSLNPAEKLAYLITRNIKQGSQWVNKVCLEPSYVGLCKLATSSGTIVWVQARCVYATDEFTDNGVGEKPTHKYNAFSKDRGDFVGVYCVAKTNDGSFLTEVMDADDVNGIMARSESIKSAAKYNKPAFGPWITDFGEMAKKSVVRRAFKTWPRSIGSAEMANAIELSNNNEGFEPMLTSPELPSYTAEQKNRFDSLIESGDSLGMFLFIQSVRDENQSIYMALYNSFEKGRITKNKAIVAEMEKSGASELREYIRAIIDGINAGDDAAVAEMVMELDQDVIDEIKQRLDSSMGRALQEIIERAT